MTFTIRPATPARFGDVAAILAPKKPGAQGCWCLTHRLTAKENGALVAPHREEEMARLCRRRGKAPGVLAYDGDEPVGWASIAPRGEFAGLDPRRFPEREDDTWVLTCFRVRAGHTRQGVAHALLAGAVEQAASKGAAAVEAYPVDARGDRIDRTQASVGTVELFARAGFEVVGDTGYHVGGHARVIVRKDL